MPTEVMIDLETLSRRANGVILSIGAVKFDPANIMQPWDNFHVAIDTAAWPEGSPMAERFHIDPDTVSWWMSPERDVARAQLHAMRKLDLASVLDAFTMWFGPDSLPTWGNASTFDNVMLRGSFEAVGIPCPWKFRDDRCYRTLKNMPGAPKLPTEGEMAGILGQAGVAHTALFDAQRQAWHLQRIYDVMGWAQPVVVPDKPAEEMTDAELGLAIGTLFGVAPESRTPEQRDQLGHLLKVSSARDLVVPAVPDRQLVDTRVTAINVEVLRLMSDEELREYTLKCRGVSSDDPRLKSLKEETLRRIYLVPTEGR